MNVNMKRLFLLAAAAVLGLAPALAQTPQSAPFRVDQVAIRKALAKSDADINDPKKGPKAATWIARGNQYLRAATAPTDGLYMQMPFQDAVNQYGEAEQSRVKVGQGEYDKFSFPFFDVYGNNGVIMFWNPKLVINPNAMQTAYDAFAKAYELDNKSAGRVQDGLKQVANRSKEVGNNFFYLGKHKEAADAIALAYDAQIHPAVAYADTMAAFNAGFLYAAANEWERGLKYLKEAQKYNYGSNGDLYYYLFHCYNGLGDMQAAKDVLMEGLQKYPKNNDIVQGLIMVYSDAGSSSREIVPIVENAIANDPNNAFLYIGLGRIYDMLDEPDKAIGAFEKSSQLAPDDYSSFFNLGLLHIKKGDAMQKELDKITFTNQADYKAEAAKVNAAYARALDPLEKAHELNPEDVQTVDLLKSVTFRLREDPAMKAKYEKYNARLQEMKASEE